MTDSDTGTTIGPSPGPPRTSRRFGRLTMILLCLVIFVSGSIVGIGGTLIFLRERAIHAVHHPDEMPTLIAARMAKVLSLSDEQRRQVEGILRKRQDALQDIRREFQPRVEEVLDGLEEDVSSVLDEEQRATWVARFDSLRRTWMPAPPPED